MDYISLLPDEIISHILTFVPTKYAVAMCTLSIHLWNIWKKKVPKLEYNDSDFESDYGRYRRFVDLSLLSHEVQGLTLHFKFDQWSFHGNIDIWLTFAFRRRVCELKIHCPSNQVYTILPKSLYYMCDSLVVLKLKNAKIIDVPIRVCFPKLKTLHLEFMKYRDNESFQRLLSSSPVLEDLVLELRSRDKLAVVTVEIPTLQRLVFIRGGSDHVKFKIDTPSLKYIEMDYHDDPECLKLNIPKVAEAIVDCYALNIVDRLFGQLTSIRRLYFGGEYEYPTGCFLHQLEYLRLNIFDCKMYCVRMIFGYLAHCPKLRALKITQSFPAEEESPKDFEEPDNVPTCLLHHFETLEWNLYFGEKHEKNLATYILKHSVRLRKATFVVVDNTDKIREALEVSPRVSRTCELVFVKRRIKFCPE